MPCCKISLRCLYCIACLVWSLYRLRGTCLPGLGLDRSMHTRSLEIAISLLLVVILLRRYGFTKSLLTSMAGFFKAWSIGSFLSFIESLLSCSTTRLDSEPGFWKKLVPFSSTCLYPCSFSALKFESPAIICVQMSKTGWRLWSELRQYICKGRRTSDTIYMCLGGKAWFEPK